MFDIWSLVVDLRRCVDTSLSAQLAGLDVAAAQCGTGGFILDPCGPARPVLAACRACERGCESSQAARARISSAHARG